MELKRSGDFRPQEAGRAKKNAGEIDALIKSGALSIEELLQELDNNPKISLQERDALRSRLAIPLSSQNEALREQIRDLEERVAIDELTGLPNRAFLKHILNNYLQQLQSEGIRRESTPQAIMIIYLDIKEFKTFNDTYGHPGGDQALLAVAQRLKEATRPTDERFRPHGDEFVIILPISGKEGDIGPEEYFNRIKNKINNNLTAEVQETLEGIEIKKFVPVRISMGYDLVKRGDKRSVDEILDRADKAMYEDKRRSQRRSSDQEESS